MEHGFEVTIGGVAGQVSVRLPSFFVGPAQILVNGEPAVAGSRPGTYLLPRPDGSSVEAVYQSGLNPKLRVDGIGYDLSPPVEKWLLALAFLPLGLAVIGGCAGGVCGGLATAFSMLMARQPWHVGVRTLLVLGAGGLAGLAYFVLAIAITLATQ